MVVPSKDNFNLLLGRECIHGIGAVPSSMHQRVVIWKYDGEVEIIKSDQSYFFAKVNHVTRKTFENILEKIAPCSFAEDGCNDQTNVSSVRLDPTHGFMWKNETPNT
ncbi:hypothetical protein MTR_7g035015 [Medicago truncatula]|uniref:Uncharacterized protein n=1 Tax=Medicago truncatula TaxID=3880 RepID=A0A072TZD3_MEDTR|nr:hypothetical protein MTR_7g035015 [Medicago truncatula]